MPVAFFRSRNFERSQKWKAIKINRNENRYIQTNKSDRQVNSNEIVKTKKNPLRPLGGNATVSIKSKHQEGDQSIDKDHMHHHTQRPETYTSVQHRETRSATHRKHYRSKHATRNINLNSEFEETNMEQFKTDEEWLPEDDWLVENLIAPAKPPKAIPKVKKKNNR